MLFTNPDDFHLPLWEHAWKSKTVDIEAAIQKAVLQERIRCAHLVLDLTASTAIAQKILEEPK